MALAGITIAITITVTNRMLLDPLLALFIRKRPQRRIIITLRARIAIQVVASLAFTEAVTVLT